MSDYSDKKDKEDYLNVHKMYLDLENIEKEIYMDETLERDNNNYSKNNNSNKVR